MRVRLIMYSARRAIIPRSTTPPTTLPAIIPMRVVSFELPELDDDVSVLEDKGVSVPDGSFVRDASVFDGDEEGVLVASVVSFVVALADAGRFPH